jgi:predicted SprT family Zn-dependent metalloprotease
MSDKKMSDAEWRKMVERTRAFAEECIKVLELTGWRFGFDRSKVRAGACHYTSRLITVSVNLVYRNTWDEVTDTILHECAHAIAGHNHGHDGYWQQICVQIGAKPQRCYDRQLVDMPKGHWQATCPGCNKLFHRHRRPRRQYHCLNCGPVRGRLTYGWGSPQQQEARQQKKGDKRQLILDKLAEMRAKRQTTQQ